MGLLVRQGFLCAKASLDPLCRALWHRALGAKASHPDQRFCRLCNLGLSKKLRFSLQRHKTAKSCAFWGQFVLWHRALVFGQRGADNPGKILCRFLFLSCHGIYAGLEAGGNCDICPFIFCVLERIAFFTGSPPKKNKNN